MIWLQIVSSEQENGCEVEEIVTNSEGSDRLITRPVSPVFGGSQVGLHVIGKLNRIHARYYNDCETMIKMLYLLGEVLTSNK